MIMQLSHVMSFLNQFPGNAAVGKTTITLKNPDPNSAAMLVNTMAVGKQQGIVMTYDLRYVDGDFCLSFELRDPSMGPGDVEAPVQLA